MSEDASSPGGMPGMFWPGLIVIAVAVLGYKTAQPFLQSARPTDTANRGFPDPPSVPDLSAFYARLWEDPLLACYQHRDNTAGDSSFLRWLGNFQTRDSNEADAKSLSSFVDFPHGPLLCLPVMLPGTPFGDDHEHRLRTAYAVHSALAVAGYDLAFPTRMSYADVSVDLTILFDGKPRTKHHEHFIVPVKLFHRSELPPRTAADGSAAEYVAVLWINEDQAQDRPLNVIGQILHGMFEPKNSCGDWKSRLKVRVLGPFDSDGLKTMRDELSTGAEKSSKYTLSGFCNSAIYSAESTLGPDSHFKDWDLSTPIYHVVGDNRSLVEALIEELKLRGATDGKVVLLSERDTLYGRTFAEEFCRLASPRIAPENLLEYRFLTGIDGALIPRPSSATEHSAGSAQTSKQGDNDPNDAPEAPPKGRAQKDYLARLEQDLVRMHHQDRMNGDPGIRAIGVVGSDVYDKLLILRALRKRFPKVVFFTTDLDAAFAKADERETARNLVVVSHFGLELSKELQQQTPPFRDSYQTATYLGALIALGYQKLGGMPPQLRADPWNYEHGPGPALKPLVFEIGLDGPYQLTLRSDPSNPLMDAVNPQSPREGIHWQRYFWRAFLLWLAVMAIAICGLAYISPLRRSLGGELDEFGGRRFMKRILKGLGIVSLVLLWPFACILFDHLRAGGQPFSMRRGISLWPATYLRYIAFCTAVLLICQTVKKLRRLQRELYERCKNAPESPHWFKWREFRRVLHLKSLPTAWDKAWGNFLVFNSPDIWRGWRRPPRVSNDRSSAMVFCIDYLQRLDFRFILVRTVPLTLAFVLFSFLLMCVDDFPSNPYRGWMSWVASIIAVNFASIAMVLLTFIVIDATQLCRRFIGSLEYADLDWDSAELAALAKARGDDTPTKWEATRALYTMQIIIDCSRVVGRLIIYPFIVVFLMVISRLPAFDYLDLNWILVLVWTLLLGMAGFSAHRLREAAKKTRREIVKRLRDELSALPTNEPRAHQQRQAIRDIENETGGAFGSLLEDPLMVALAIPFGGSTLLLIIQQLLPYLIL